MSRTNLRRKSPAKATCFSGRYDQAQAEEVAKKLTQETGNPYSARRCKQGCKRKNGSKAWHVDLADPNN